MLSMILLGLACVLVGFLYSSTGVGGILLVPALSLLGGLDTHTAMATTLASFVFTSIHVCWLYARRGLMQIAVVTPLIVGGLLCGYLGALTKSLLPGPLLNLILAALIFVAAGNILRPAGRGAYSFADAAPRLRGTFLLGLGGFVGFVAGLTGAGGPVISTPVMIYFGFSPLCSIGAGAAFSIGAGISGTAGNLMHGNIDIPHMLGITVLQMCGAVVGVRLACRIPAQMLRKAVAYVCISVALVILFQAVLGWGK